MHDSGASPRGNAKLYPLSAGTPHLSAVIAHEKAGDPYSEALVMEPKSRGVLDTPHARACGGYDGSLWSGASAPLPMKKLDCFVACAPRNDDKSRPASAHLALARRRAMRLFGREMR